MFGAIDATYELNDYVYVKWNDATNDFQIDVHDDLDVYKSTETSGPDLTQVDYVVTDYNYQFCDSSTLVTFDLNLTLFPYGVRVNTANASQCAVNHVCNILVTDVTVTATSTSTDTDGQAVVTVSGPDSPFTYSLTLRGGQQSSNTFTGLAPGEYTVYVRDIYSCLSTKTFTVGFVSDYQPRWRMDFDSRLAECNNSYRVDILERNYVGSVSDICGSDIPFVINWQGDNEDKFKPTIASKATLNITVQNAGEFEDIFTGDERQFLVKFYIDEGSGFNLEWTGYILQESYEENWQAEPYYISFMATDGLADLANEDFDFQRGDKSLINIISQCLEPTGLFLDIHSAINRFETNQTTAAGDDPLAQTYFDTYFLFGKTKKQVLEDIMVTFGAHIKQSGAVWWLVSVEDTVSTSLPYRVFGSNGVYQSNSTLSPQVYIAFPDQINRMAWTGIPLMSIRNGYKRVNIIHNMGLVNNIFYTGRFDEDDYNENTKLFQDIGLDLINTNGVDYGLEKISNGPSEDALYIDFSNSSTGSLNFPLVFTLNKSVVQGIGYFKLRFSYYVNSTSPAFVRLLWRVKVGSDYLQPSGSYSSDTDFQYCPIYVEPSNYNKWNTFELDFNSLGTDMQVTLNLYSNNSYDFSSLAALAAANAATYRLGDRRIVLDNVAGDLFLRSYTLNFSNDATLSPDVIRAADWASTKRVWLLDSTSEFSGSQTNTVLYYLIDELGVEYFPLGVEPDETNEYAVTINQSNKVDFEKEVFFGDLPGTLNDEHLYKNAFKLSDGSYTELWGRATLAEEIPILDILALDISGQYAIGTRTLNGSLIGDRKLRMENCLINKADSDRAFMILGMEADYLNNNYTVELPEIKTGVTGPPSDTSGFTGGFSLGFRS
jgi:hypothetical protein